MLTTVGAIFGGYSVATNAILHSTTVSPLVFAFLRDVIGSVTLLTAAALVESRKPGGGNWRMQWADCGSFMLVGLTGVYGAQGMSAMALKYTTSFFFSTVSNLQPVVGLILSIMLGLERWRPSEYTAWLKVLGVVLAVGSAVAVVLVSSADAGGGVVQESSNFGLGVFFCSLQIVLGGALHAVQKPLFSRYPALVVVGWGYFCGTCLLLLSLITSATNAADWDLTLPAVGAVAFAGILGSGVAYGMMALCNSWTGPVFVQCFSPSQAVFAALFGWAFAGRALPGAALGFVAVLAAGIACIVCAQHREGRTADAAKLGDAGATAQVDGGGGWPSKQPLLPPADQSRLVVRRASEISDQVASVGSRNSFKL